MFIQRKKFLISLMALSLFIVFPVTDAGARKFNYSYNRSGKNLRLMKSFITNTGNANRARRISSRVRQGQKIHFYYKIGPIRVQKRRGAPYRTRLVIKRGGRSIKDFGWKNSNAVKRHQRRKNKTYGWFHTARWNLKLSSRTRPGRYTAIVSHRDLNTRRTVTIRYNFTVTGGSGAYKHTRRGGDNIQKFINAAKRKDTSRLSSFFSNRAVFTSPQYGFKDLKNDIKSGAPVSRRGKKIVTLGVASVYFSKIGGKMKVTQVSCHGCGRGGGN